MNIKDMIYKVRTNANMSREQFAELLGVSRQSVQKWENGDCAPELDKIIKISKYFDISLDTLVLGNDSRLTEEAKYNKKIRPNYANIHNEEFYTSNLDVEYTQSIEEGLDIEAYKDVFSAVAGLPKDEIKKRIGDVLFDVVLNAKQKEDYKYVEPSELEKIKFLRKEHEYEKTQPSKEQLEEKIHGAWMGRICGCMLGKTVEGIRTNELIPFLKGSDNYPMHRYILRSDINDEIIEKYSYPFAQRHYADEIDGMPYDDDTNYVILSQVIIEKHGRDFTARDVSQAWLDYQPRYAYWTAERVAFCNFINGYEPPASAIYKNPFREWIGAQIRGDYYGYINPGDPQAAAEMAFRDASISHIKNGIYGEMFASAMIAAAAVTNNIEDIIKAGLAEIPHTSRLYEAITKVIDGFKNGAEQKSCFDNIHKQYDEYTGHGWCHTIPNAMIVAASLLYGGGDYSKSICMAVETGFDTDCNGATVGSVLGMANGIKSIPEYWTKPINDTLYTTIFGFDKVKISDRVKLTLKHIDSKN